MVDFVEREIPFIEEEIFPERFAGELHKLSNKSKNDTRHLEAFAKQHNAFRAAACAYAGLPAQKNERNLKRATMALEAMATEDVEKCLSLTAITTFKVAAAASAEFKEAYKNFMVKVMLAVKDPSAIQQMIDSVFDVIGIAAEKLLSFGKEFNAGKAGKYYVSGAVLDAFRGRTSLSPLLESRVHGYADSDVNTAFDDKNVA